MQNVALLTAFPDARVVFDDFVVDADAIAARFRFHGTHRGEFMGIPPTNRSVSVAGLTVMRFEGTRVGERWSEMDYLGLLEALGVSPFPD